MTTPVDKPSEATLSEVAAAARQRHEEQTKVLDRTAVKLEVCIVCAVGEVGYAPPLRMRVNGLILPLELNTEGETQNPLTVWWDTPVRARGPDALEVALEPIEGAERHFKRSRSGKHRYLGAYSRNALEAQGRVYQVPPEEEGEAFPAHAVRLRVSPKRRLGIRRMDGIPDRWRLK